MSVVSQTIYDLDAIRKEYLDAPDDAVFLERAHVLADCIARFSSDPPGLRQGKTFTELCSRVTTVVTLADTLPCRILEERPSPADEDFIRTRPELFTEPGAKGFLESTGIYAPDWRHLLAVGISGLLTEVESARAAVPDSEPDSASCRDHLDGVAMSLSAISNLALRYEEAARNLARRANAGLISAHLMQAANACEFVATKPPESLRDALQLFLLYHMVLSCLAGGRNVTPGRMDQWLLPFWQRDVGSGLIPREEGIELLAIAMIELNQLSGKYSVDFQSSKHTPCRHSHYYITLAGVTPDGKSAVNDLSFAILDALRLVKFREPSVMVRYTTDIDRRFWREALSATRDRLPVFAYNDRIVIEGLTHHGTPLALVRNYVHAGCMNCILPGEGSACMRDNFDMSACLLAAIDNASANRAADFNAFFDTLRAETRKRVAEQVAGYTNTARRYPLPAWPLFHGHLEAGHEYWERYSRYVDLHLTSVATLVDSLLAIDQTVYRDRVLTLDEFREILRNNYAGQETFRQYILNHCPSYGSDEPVVLQMIGRAGRMWIEEVEALSPISAGIALRPGFHSWLFNVTTGPTTGATPDGRLAGEPLSSDFLPARMHGRAYTEVLRSISALPLACTPSGGTSFALDASHFQGKEGLDRLSALVEGHFAEGGLQLHFIFTDRETLLDAVKNPDKHSDLLVRVTGFSEYFVRLLPEIQQDIIKRSEK